MDAWAGELNDAENDSVFTHERMTEFLLENDAVRYILWSDTTLQNSYLWSLEEDKNSEIEALLLDSLKSKQAELEQLRTFQKGGYSKKEPIGRLNVEGLLTNQSGLIFLFENGIDYQVCLMVLDPRLFITSTLAQKIQSVAQENFIISAYDENSNVQVAVMDSIKQQLPYKKPLWLLPDYSLGIVLKGETIQNLARQRTVNNLLILIGVDLILLAGLWLVYRNIKKQIQLAQIKEDFVSNVSHEIRTPLALISMFAETLEMDRAAGEAKKKEYYSIIRHEANRLATIVNKILSFSKMEAGKVNYELEPTDLSGLVKDVLRTYDYHLKSQGINCKFTDQLNIPVVQADPNAVSEAIINLLDNAIKYSNGSKEIEVNMGTATNEVSIEVRDYGLGISAEDQKYIFDKFYRVPTGAVHNTKGTGLGLTLVRSIMEAHGGSVKIQSNSGQGSSFKLAFPIVP